jgi:hypothetical protein
LIYNYLNSAECEVTDRKQFFLFVSKAIPPEASKYNRMFRARLILELYKYLLIDVLANPEIIRMEIDALLTELESLFDQETPNLLLPGKDQTIVLGNSRISPLPDIEAMNIHARYHYLLTPRRGKFHLGLFSEDGRMLGLASFSENDLSHLNSILPPGIEQQDTLVLSRFVTFDHTPFNTPTRFLAQTSRWIRRNFPGVRLVLSYLDPNLGFEGTIYKAYNAVLVAEESKKRYLYFNGRYVSDRSMLERFGTADFKKLSELDLAVSLSKEKLLPLQVFAWDIRRKQSIGYGIDSRMISPHANLVG